MLFGYAWVSTAEQNPAHQIEALLRAGTAEDDIHLDHASSAQASRPQLNLLLQRLREGDLPLTGRGDGILMNDRAAS